MDLKLKEKRFIISGSSRGIGRGIAESLLREGAKVVLTGRDAERLRESTTILSKIFDKSVLSISGDINERGGLLAIEKQTVKYWGGIDGIVANVGGVRPVPPVSIDEADWEWYFETNFKSAYRFVTHFIPHLKNSGGGVVFIGSIAGLEDLGAPLPYSSSKMALTMYAKGLARRLGQYGVRVNTVAPGNILFPGGNWAKRQTEDPERVRRMIESQVPLARFGTPEDVANVVTFLLSPRSSFVTGSCVVVDGGQTLGI